MMRMSMCHFLTLQTVVIETMTDIRFVRSTITKIIRVSGKTAKNVKTILIYQITLIMRLMMLILKNWKILQQ